MTSQQKDAQPVSRPDAGQGVPRRPRPTSREDQLETYQSIVDSIYNGVMVTDANGYVTHFNKPYGKFLGVEPKDQIGRHCTEVVENTRLADEAGRALGEIENVSEELSTLIGAMATTASSQSEQATTVSESMVKIREVSTQTSETATEAADSVGRLSVLAQQLKASVSGFRLPA